jgi:NAD(P)H-nitrite reductase large subunit
MRKIAIIGNGIAGITAARHLRKLGNDEIVVISGETEHFFSRTALMYIYMGHMTYEHTKPYEDWFWSKNNIQLVHAWVQALKPEEKKLTLSNGKSITYDVLIIATGSKSNKFGWPGQDLPGVQGLYSYQDLELMEENTRDISTAVIVGGGLIGVEMAEMLRTRNIEVVFLIREKEFWDIVLPREEASLIGRHIQQHHIDLRKETELEKILVGENGRVKGVKTKSGETINCQYVGLTVGVSPNVDFLRDSQLEMNRGVLIDRYLRTNLQDVYAIGDCAEFRDPITNRRPVEQVWYTGRMHGETVAHTIMGKETEYKPGIWFNSAKFFDIEYQTYGHVWSQLKEDEQQFYWEHKDGRKCIKFVYHKDTKKLLGVNTFGIRLRHQVMDQWLREARDIFYVLKHLRNANFDPEFFKRYEGEIVGLFNQQNPSTPVKLNKSVFAGLFS